MRQTSIINKTAEWKETDYGGGNCVNAGPAMQRLCNTNLPSARKPQDSLIVHGDGANCKPATAGVLPHTDKTDLVSKNTLDKLG